jgi:hypothetical protein
MGATLICRRPVCLTKPQVPVRFASEWKRLADGPSNYQKIFDDRKRGNWRARTRSQPCRPVMVALVLPGTGECKIVMAETNGFSGDKFPRI